MKTVIPKSLPSSKHMQTYTSTMLMQIRKKHLLNAGLQMEQSLLNLNFIDIRSPQAPPLKNLNFTIVLTWEI